MLANMWALFFESACHSCMDMYMTILSILFVQEWRYSEVVQCIHQVRVLMDTFPWLRQILNFRTCRDVSSKFNIQRCVLAL